MFNARWLDLIMISFFAHCVTGCAQQMPSDALQYAYPSLYLLF